MRSIRQIDQFAKDVGIKQETTCEMCDLLTVDIHRQREETGRREELCWFLVNLALSRESRLRLWQLIAFAGWVGVGLLWVMGRHA